MVSFVQQHDGNVGPNNTKKRVSTFHHFSRSNRAIHIMIRTKLKFIYIDLVKRATSFNVIEIGL